MNIRKREINAKLSFKGGLEADSVDKIPRRHGIYVAFACFDRGEEYECSSLVYIGKAEGTDDLRSRVADHVNGNNQPKNERQKFWEQEYCKNGEVIVYVYAEHEEDLGDIESALIYKNQPEANIHSKDRYTGTAWYVNVVGEGNIGILKGEITAMRLIPRSR